MLAQHTIPCQLSTGFLHLLFIPVLLKTEKYWKQNPIWIEKVWPLLQRTVFLISLSWHDTGVEYDIDLPISWIKFPANKDNWTLRNYSPMLPYRLIKKKTWFFYFFSMKCMYVQLIENYWQLICLRDFWVLYGLKLIALHCIYATPKHKIPKEMYRTKKRALPSNCSFILICTETLKKNCLQKAKRILCLPFPITSINYLHSFPYNNKLWLF